MSGEEGRSPARGRIGWLEVAIVIGIVLFLGWLAFSVVAFVTSLIWSLVKVVIAIALIALVVRLVFHRRSHR